MKNPIHINELIKPVSSGFAALSLKHLYSNLAARYIALQKEIKYEVIREKDTYYIHFSIPSESNEKYPGSPIIYDVILEFYPKNNDDKLSDSIKDYGVKAFSNDPNFMYTFTYAFNERNGLIDEKRLYSKKALKEKPKSRNPLLLLGVSSYIYFSLTFMERKHLFTKNVIENETRNKTSFSSASIDELLKRIPSQEKKKIENDIRLIKFNKKKSFNRKSYDRRTIKTMEKQGAIPKSILSSDDILKYKRMDKNPLLASTLIKKEEKEKRLKSKLSERKLLRKK